ncbi:multiheme c-type cytochrome [Thermodesulfobacteriota bacterium]
MKKRFCLTIIVVMWILAHLAAPAVSEDLVSDATNECLECHASIHPGIVEDWRNSRHAQTTPKKAMAIQGPAKKVSSKSVPESLQNQAVGCAECHTLRPEAHADTFDHNEYRIHVVVSPGDCATCHVTERTQFDKNLMSHAVNNLAGNPLYQDLQRTILGETHIAGGKIGFSPANDLTRADACFYCHGTRLEVTGTETRDTDAGELEFPIIKGWPNQGVGRVNLDGSRGACSACHTRHQFSIEMARKPYTCKECHSGPDVPAFKVYAASKHGNIFSGMNSTWNFKAVPWTVGKDFTAPTCAACHVSLLVNTDGETINERSHQMNDRLERRIFGLIYAHPYPKDPDTTKIRNKDGLSLPTDFEGGLAQDYLIGLDEQKIRRETMQNTCLSCHDTSWVKSHFERLDNTIQTSNAKVLTATGLVSSAWTKGYAQGPGQKGSPFDEFIERRWSDVWLLYANNVRFVSAMAGGGDYGVYEDGRYHLTNALLEMQSWLETRDMVSAEKKK